MAPVVQSLLYYYIPMKSLKTGLSQQESLFQRRFLSYRQHGKKIWQHLSFTHVITDVEQSSNLTEILNTEETLDKGCTH